MPSERILIVGAGVSGSILAYWLARNSFHVTVIERSKASQKAGQGIEIEEPALQVVKAMGILDKLQAKRTGEEGFDLVDERSRSWAKLLIGGFSPTGALELMRGDLTEILYQTADEMENVEYRFETVVKSLEQREDEVVVEMENRKDGSAKVETFDFVVGADGVRSRTRQMVMGSNEQLGCIKNVGAYVAYFSIPRKEEDWPLAKMCHFTGRRNMWLRPTREESKTTSVYLIHLNNDVPNLRKANAANDRTKQKQAFADLYSGLGWEAPRVIEQMLKSDNFYSDELVQIKLKKWSEHRVVLLGDAAFAPSPFTGQGNQLAIISGWVLAQELSRNRSTVAFDRYEKRMRGYVESSQSIPLGGYMPYILVPATSWGILLLRIVFFSFSWLLRFASWLKLTALMPKREHDSEFDLQMGVDKAKVAT